MGVITVATFLQLAVAPRQVHDWRGWIDLVALPDAAAISYFVAFAFGVAAWRILPMPGRGFVRGIVGLGAAVAAWDTVRYWRALADGELAGGPLVPLSLLTAFSLALWASWASAARRRPRRPQRLLTLVAIGAGCPLALAAHVHWSGATDHRRPADAIVVFGARVRPSGEPTLSLADRTRTACSLWQADLAPVLVYSGGRDVGNRLSEAESMRELGRSLGIPDQAVILDDLGNNTRATVQNVAALAREHHWQRILFVSHDYHLARIRMFARREGLNGYTVPAHETRPLAKETQFFLRELAAITYYFFEPVLPEQWRRSGAG